MDEQFDESELEILENDDLEERKRKLKDKRRMSKMTTKIVLDKWDTKGKGELTQTDIEKAASKVANLKNRHNTLKWVVALTLIGIVFLLGLMIGSVVIGVKVSRDVKVNNGELVSADDSQTIKVSTSTYSNPLSLSAPVDLVFSTSVIRYPFVVSKNSTLMYFGFKVVEYFYSSFEIIYFGDKFAIGVYSEYIVLYEIDKTKPVDPQLDLMTNLRNSLKGIEKTKILKDETKRDANVDGKQNDEKTTTKRDIVDDIIRDALNHIQQILDSVQDIIVPEISLTTNPIAKTGIGGCRSGGACANAGIQGGIARD